MIPAILQTTASRVKRWYLEEVHYSKQAEKCCNDSRPLQICEPRDPVSIQAAMPSRAMHADKPHWKAHSFNSSKEASHLISHRQQAVLDAHLFWHGGIF